MTSSLVFTLLGIDKLSDKFDDNTKAAEAFERQLSKFGNTGVKSLAGLAGASLAGSAAVGTALGGMALAFGGAALALTSSNEQVASSAQKLSLDVMASLHAAAEPLAGYTQEVLGSFRDTYGQLEPLINDAFKNGAPQVLTFTRGINQLALNAFPGMVAATRNSTVAVEGMADMLSKTGQGVGGFFRELSAHSASGGAAFTALGSIVRTVLPAVARLLGELADVAAARGPQIVRVIDNVATITENFAGGALPVMSSALGVLLDALNGVAAVLGPFSGTLGSVVGVALSVGAAFRVVGVATNALQKADSVIGSFVTRTREGLSAATGFGAKMGALTSMVGGPFGVAMAGATIGLALLGAAQEDAAEKAQQHTTFTQALTASLRESNGVMDLAARKTVASNDTVKEAISAGKQFSLTSATIVDAVLGQGTALDDTRAKLGKIIEETKIYATTETGDYAWTGAYRGQGQAAADLLDQLNGLNKGTAESVEAQKAYGQALSSAGQSMLTTTAAGTKLTSAVGIMRDVASSATDRMTALLDVLNALTGDSLSLSEAQARMNQNLIQLGDLASSSTDHTKGWGDALVDANGAINTMLPNGQALFSTLSGLRDNTAKVSQATFDMSQAQGDALPVSLDKAKKAVQGSRDQMIDLAVKMGISRDRAVALVDAFDLVPDTVETAILTPGMTESQKELAILRGRVQDVPGTKSIVCNSLTDEAVKQLQSLGYTVTHLPDGRVRVDSNTDPAWARLNDFLNTRVSKSVPVTYYATNSPGSPSNMRLNATGAVLMPMAAGGLRASAMSGKVADVVRPGTLRVIGDNPRFPEVFAPLDGSVRTKQILTMANELQGVSTGGSTVVVAAAGGGGGPQVVNFYVSFPEITDGPGVRRTLLELKRDLGGAPLGFE